MTPEYISGKGLAADFGLGLQPRMALRPAPPEGQAPALCWGGQGTKGNLLSGRTVAART